MTSQISHIFILKKVRYSFSIIMIYNCFGVYEQVGHVNNFSNDSKPPVDKKKKKSKIHLMILNKGWSL